MNGPGPIWARSALANDCALCGGLILADELHVAGNQVVQGRQHHACLSCTFTAMASACPGELSVVRIEAVLGLDAEPGATAWHFRVFVGAEDVGLASVDKLIDADQQGPATLAVILRTLNNSAARKARRPDRRYKLPELGDGWCTGQPPVNEWVVTWARNARGEESWTPGVVLPCELSPAWKAGGYDWPMPGHFTTDGGVSLVWHFTYQKMPDPSILVLAWKRGPARPRFLDAGDVVAP